MPSTSTPAVLLRRIEFGDYDLIVTLLTPDQGKTSAIAKSAKKSVKRFSGVLEPFSRIDVVLTKGRGKGLAVLQEATLEDPFFRIRENVIHTAYASYWAELICLWLAEGDPQADLYRLITHVLAELNRGRISVEVLSTLFQMRFLTLAGFRPNFDHCHVCKTVLDQIRSAAVVPDPSMGGIACPDCGIPDNGRVRISKGTLKRLTWLDKGDLQQAARVRFSPGALAEGLHFLEAFVPYHIGTSPKSLNVLRTLRRQVGNGAPAGAKMAPRH